MTQITLEMPMVSRCDIKQCGFNTNNCCHAKAITIGDSIRPGCDTFMETTHHTYEAKRTAGVGACKTSGCKYNDDFECIADTVSVGFVNGEINCLAYLAR